MNSTPTTAAATHAGLAGVVDVVGQLDLAALEPGEASELLGALCNISDRLTGEIARVAAAVAQSGEWISSGATSMASFVSNMTGMAIGKARGAVELGDAMTVVPALDAAVRSGAVSPAAAAAVVPTIDDDGFAEVAAELIAELAGQTPAKAQRHVEAWRASANRDDDDARRSKAHEQRTLTFRSAGDGMTHIEGVLPNEIAQGLRRTLNHLAGQQRLDGTDRTRQQRSVDAVGDLVGAYERGEVVGGRNVPRLIVTTTLENLENRAGVATNAEGELVTSAEIDQLCCDAKIHRYVADQHGAVLNFGRGRRTASPQQFLALVARDQGCRHPGCDRPPHWCEAHHLREFSAHGGFTNVDELVLLCHHHHHALHDSSWVLDGDTTHLVFTGPVGQQLHSTLHARQTTAQRTLPQHVTTNAA